MRECDQRNGDEHNKPHEGDEQKPHDGDEQKPHNSDKQKQLQTVQAAQQMYWAQLHEAQQKVQEADNERIANEDRLSTTRVGDMTDEDLGHELVLFSAFVSKFVGRREN